MPIPCKTKLIFLTGIVFLLSPLARGANDPPPPGSSPEATPRNQAEDFRLSAELNTALGAYTQQYDTNAELGQGELKSKVIDCINSTSDCSQEDVFKSLIQYNLQREIEKNTLENSTNARNMQTISGHGIPMQSGATIDPKPRVPFKIDINAVHDAINKMPKEAEILGPKFQEQYSMFINNYSRPVENTYVKSEKVNDTGVTTEVELKTNGQPVIDRNRFQTDVMLQHDARAQALLLTSPSPNPKDKEAMRQDMQNELEAVGLDKDISAERSLHGAIGINATIEERLKDVRAANPKPDEIVNESYTRTVDDFNVFLDRIWPPSAAPREVASVRSAEHLTSGGGRIDREGPRVRRGDEDDRR